MKKQKRMINYEKKRKLKKNFNYSQENLKKKQRTKRKFQRRTVYPLKFISK